MSSDDQKLESGINQLMGGIGELQRAILARIENSESWTTDHLENLARLHTDLTTLRLRLTNLRKHTS